MSVELGNGDVYKGFCVSCFCRAKPNDDLARRARSNVHAKERVIMPELEVAFPGYKWHYDKRFVHRTFLVGINTRFRPDARVTRGDRVLIVEVDENSHRGYLCEKEREREASFVAQNRSKTVVMIRFNPDAYTDYDGNRIPSCFTSPTKDNETTHVPPKQKKALEARIRELVETIRTLSDPDFELPPKQEDRPLLICELFYDNVIATPEDKRVAKEVWAHKAMGKRKAECAKNALLANLGTGSKRKRPIYDEEGDDDDD